MRLSHCLCIGALVGCVPRAFVASIDQRLRGPTTLATRAATPAPDEPEAALRAGVTRGLLARLAVARDPGVRARAAMARSLAHAARAESSRPPPELGAQIWNLPLTRPWALGEADMYMLELRGMFPPAGALEGRARAMLAEADETLAEVRGRELELTRSASVLHAEYVAAARRLSVHRGHLSQIGAMHDAARARYEAANASMVELNRVEVERARLERSIARDEGELARAMGAINALLQRPNDAPLGAPLDAEPARIDEGLDALLARADARPEARQAHARAEAALRRAEAAHSESVTPTVSLGGSYWQMPGERPGFGATASMTLPWLSGGARAQERSSRERAVAEQESEREAAFDARRQIAEAWARMRTAARELAVLTGESRAHAHAAVEAARVSYITGRSDLLTWIDAAREALDIETDEIDLVRELAAAEAELEWSVGAPLERRAIGGAP